MIAARLRTSGCALVAAALAAWLAACSSTAPRPAPGARASGASGAPAEPRSAGARSAPAGSAAPAAVGTAPAVPLPTNPRGGYYGDDGPPDTVPPGLELTPDAVPRPEPLRERANRPYAIFGRPYVPMTQHAPYRERGMASWYGRKFHGQSTSIGETYDMFGMSAAHPTLPLPSYVRVTNLRNGRSVVVRVNDRGPFLNNRLIDLSYTAALKLGYVQHGSADVEVELLLPHEPSFRILQASADGAAAEAPPAAALRATPLGAGPAAAPAQPPRPAVAAGAAPPTPNDPGVQLVVETLPTTAAGSPGHATPPDPAIAASAPGAAGAHPALALGASSAAGAPSPQPAAGAAAAATQGAAPARLPAGTTPAAYLQLGAFASRVNAEAARHRAGSLLDVGTPVDIVEDRGMFKLLAGPLPRREVARLAERIQHATGSRPFAVSR